MKYIKTYKIFENLNSELISELEKYNIQNYTINEDGSIDVNDDVIFSYITLIEIPFNFGKVSGDFYCENKKLTSLKGCPSKVFGDFQCYNNKLTSLEFAPLEIDGNFGCYKNKLTSLENCPLEIGGNLFCSYNKLTSLRGCPTEIGRDFICSSNKLESLEYCPLEIGSHFDCSFNKLTMLDCSSYIKGDIYCEGMFTEEPEFFGDCEGKIKWK